MSDLEIKPGTQSGEVITLRGQGRDPPARHRPRRPASCTSSVQTPTRLAEEQERLLRQLADAARRGAPGGPARAGQPAASSASCATRSSASDAAVTAPLFFLVDAGRSTAPRPVGTVVLAGAEGRHAATVRRIARRRARAASPTARAARRAAVVQPVDARRACSCGSCESLERVPAAVPALRAGAGAGQGRPRRAGDRGGHRARRRRGRALAGRAQRSSSGAVSGPPSRAASGSRSCSPRPSSPGAPAVPTVAPAADRRAVVGPRRARPRWPWCCTRTPAPAGRPCRCPPTVTCCWWSAPRAASVRRARRVRRRGALSVRLGDTVLRSSTAGPAALAVLSAAGRWR